MKKILLMMAIVLGTAGLAAAQDAVETQDEAAVAATPAAQTPAAEQASKDKEKDTFTIATVSGEISGITKRSISVVYNRDYDTGTEYEVLIPVDDGTQFKHKQALSDLKVGDLISVEYENPDKDSKHKARARVVNFVQSGVSTLTTQPKDTVANTGQ